MISAFCMGPAASGRGLCDIDRVLFRVAKSRVKKLGSRRKYTNIFFDLSNNRYIFALPGLPNFLTRYLVTLNNILSISHSPRPLAAGPIRNAGNMASLLVILHL